MSLKSLKTIFFIITIAILIFTGCKKDVPTLPTPAPTTNAYKGETLIFASIPMDNRLKMLEGWTLLAENITKETGIPVEVHIKKSYYEIIEALSNKEVDFCYTGPLIYVEAHDKTGAIPLVKPTAHGKPFYNSIIIVRKDSGINKLSDLKGKKFAFTDRNSTSGYLFPRAMLAYNGITDLKYFSGVIFTGGHDSSFEGVYQKYVDGAGIFDYPFVREKDKDPKTNDLKILFTSEPIPMGPIAIRKDLSPETAKKLRDYFVKIGKTEETKEIAEKIKVDGYVDAKDSDYNSIRKALKTIEKLGEKYKGE